MCRGRTGRFLLWQLQELPSSTHKSVLHAHNIVVKQDATKYEIYVLLLLACIKTEVRSRDAATAATTAAAAAAAVAASSTPAQPCHELVQANARAARASSAVTTEVPCATVPLPSAEKRRVLLSTPAVILASAAAPPPPPPALPPLDCSSCSARQSRARMCGRPSTASMTACLQTRCAQKGFGLKDSTALGTPWLLPHVAPLPASRHRHRASACLHHPLRLLRLLHLVRPPGHGRGRLDPPSARHAAPQARAHGPVSVRGNGVTCAPRMQQLGSGSSTARGAKAQGGVTKEKGHQSSRSRAICSGA